MTAQVDSPISPSASPIDSEADNRRLTKNWIILGIVAGILGDLAYASAIAPIPLPSSVRMYLGFAFGPLLSLAFVGLYHFFKLHRKTPTLQAATIFGVIAGTLVNVMLVVQSAIFQTVPSAARADLGLAFDGVNMVQLGMDISWDIYFSLATILFGLVMLGHPRFGWVWGGISILIGGGLLTLNLATFPIPPAEAGSVDLGPLSGVWYLIVTIRIITSMKWVDARLAIPSRDLGLEAE